ncbi:methyltransferase [Aminiphilus sp.]|jgi:tRNA1Val (adenine37-N6)-methyltransferase|uniref:tRNA1(Val) (adenine(37)-N6)-methyltransferase n=1 Tax=Aminiphilus sp. TaxID=1872488 RepID=UPI00262B68BB|nr:methyltransferase [Aminiphilus sp.]
MEFTRDDLLWGELSLLQPRTGPRVTVDTVLLAAFTRVKARERVLELGSASGAVSLLLGWRFPEAEEILGLEIQEDLVSLAARNAAENGLADRVRFLPGDLRRMKELLPPESRSVVVANPPYDEEGTGRPSPVRSEAVARHGLCCTLEDVVSGARWVLPTGGRFYVVIRARRGAELLGRLRENGLEPKRIRSVHPRPEKNAFLLLVQSTKGAGAGLVVEPPLFVADEKGATSAECLRAYSKEGLSCP